MARLFTLLPLLLLLASCKKESDVALATKQGILIVGNSNEPKGLDPHLVSGVLESNIIRALFEGLCVEDPQQDGVALPGAAASWETNEDFTVWTFQLQPDAKWSDGVPVTAHDFVFSYKRLLSPDPDWPAEYAEMLHFIKNAEAYHRNQRGYILCGQDFINFASPWDDLKKANFAGDPKINPEPHIGKKLAELEAGPRNHFLTYIDEDADLDFERLTNADFKKLSADERLLRINFKGLDKLGEEELSYIEATPTAFQWPVNIAMEARAETLRRLIDHRRAGSPSLWDAANVGVIAVDDFTLRIELRGPIPFLPEITKHYTWYPVPRHYILKHGSINTAYSSRWTEPPSEENPTGMVSNGPFKLKVWRTNHFIEVERNPHYWDLENVALHGVRYLPINNSYTETRMFADDQLHATYIVPSELIPYAKKHFSKELRQENYVGVRFVRTNTKREPFNNPKVRQAFAAAIDQEAICEKILMGGQKPAGGVVPPFGDYQSPAIIKFDPDKARKLLAESGYQNASNFPTISILTTDNDSGRREAEALQAMWERHLGIKARIVQREWSNYLQRQNDSDFDLCVAGWIGDYLDPTTFLEMWSEGNGNNNTGWSSDKYEQLLEQAENTSEAAKRLPLLAEAETLMLKDAPVLPIYFYTINYLIRPEVKNWHPLLLNNHPYKFVKLEPSFHSPH